MTATAPRTARGDASETHVIRVAADGAERARQIAQIERALRSGERVWVDLDLSDPAHAAILTDVFAFHPRAVEAALATETRVTVEEFEDALFFVVRAIAFCESTPDDPYDLETSNIAVFVGREFLVTAHFGSLASVDEIVAAVARDPRILAAGSARVAQLLADATIDEFFPLLDRIEDFVDGLEDRVFTNFDRGALHDIFQVKRVVLQMRRFLAPEREVIGRLANRPTPFVPPETQLYFRGTYDRVLRLTEALDSYRELLAGTLEGFLTQVSNQLGRVTKTLSVFATLSIPFVVVSGMYGMNFDRIPLASHPHGFWLLVVIQAVMALGLIGFLRWLRVL